MVFQERLKNFFNLEAHLNKIKKINKRSDHLDNIFPVYFPWDFNGIESKQACPEFATLFLRVIWGRRPTSYTTYLP